MTCNRCQVLFSSRDVSSHSSFRTDSILFKEIRASKMLPGLTDPKVFHPYVRLYLLDFAEVQFLNMETLVKMVFICSN